MIDQGFLLLFPFEFVARFGETKKDSAPIRIKQNPNRGPYHKDCSNWRIRSFFLPEKHVQPMERWVWCGKERKKKQGGVWITSSLPGPTNKSQDESGLSPKCGCSYQRWSPSVTWVQQGQEEDRPAKERHELSQKGGTVKKHPLRLSRRKEIE